MKRIATAHYAVAALAVAAGIGLRLALDPVLGAQVPYITFFGAVLIAARLGGRGPALFSTALSVLSVWYFFLGPRFSFEVARPTDFVGLALFTIIAAAISFLEPGGGAVSTKAAAGRRAQEDSNLVGASLLRRIAMITGAAVASGILASLLWTGFTRTSEADHWVEHTYQVLNSAESVRSSLESAETSERGYLLTGDEQYLKTYRGAVASEQRAQAVLRGLTVDNALQQTRLNEFDRTVRIRLDLMASMIEVGKRQGTAAAAAALARVKTGKEAMDQLRAILDAVDNEERRLLHIRTLAASEADSRTRWILGLGSGSLVLLLIIAGAAIERNAHERKLVEKMLEDQSRLIDLSHDAIITANGSRVITGWNSGAQELYGWSEKEALGKTIHDLLRTRTDIPISAIDGILHRAGRWDGELKHIARDGRRIVVDSRHVLLRDSRNQPVGILEINRDITEKKRSEEALRESEAQFRTLANAIPHLCWIANADGWIFWYNDRWYEYTGTSPEQMEGWGWQSVHDPEALSSVLDRWKGSIATGEPFDMVFPLRGADRIFRPFLTRVMPLRDRDGKVIRWFGTNTDITEQRKTEEALRHASEQRELAMEAAELGAWDFDPATGEVFRDERARRLLGVAAPRIGYEESLVRVHEEDRTAVTQKAQQALAGENEGAYHSEFRVTWPDSSVHWLASHGRVLFEADGGRRRAVRFVGVNMDITERRRAEEALRESQARLEAALASMTDAVFISDAEGRFVHTNDAFATFHRFGDKAECAQTLAAYPAILEVFLPNGSLAPLEMWAVPRALRGETATNSEYTLRRKDTGESWVGSYSFAPIRDREGAIAGSVVVGRDITGRKRAEEEIRRLNADLEQRVRDRTAQLEASNRELEAFAYSVSHDLRAPLRGIDGWSLALVEDYGKQLDQRALKYLDRVRTETQRMGRLIDDLLQLSRITRSEMQLDRVDLSGTAESIAARLQEADPQKRLEFSIRPGLAAFGDARLLEVALTNLMQNAVKFTGPRAHARIEFETVECGGKTAFMVRDNGVGFDMAYAGTLFGAFQRLHSDSEFPGTGIGLATVQRVIHRHGGQIWAEAEPDRGASFYFTLGLER